MSASNLRMVERKVLGAMMILADDDMFVRAKLRDVASVMGYKAMGGAVSFAVQALEMKNYISKSEEGYKVLV